jgi:radical SAM protein with 4Fe4S-binding SPASM domain
LCFSIDALTKETYEKVREGGNYDKVIWAIDEALHYRYSKNNVLPIIRASWVTNTYNEHELDDFIKYFSTKVDYVDIQPLFLGTTGLKQERKKDDIYVDSKDLIPSRSRKIEDYRCMSPWSTMVIRGNGDAISCPNFSGAKQIMGNISNSSIKEIWNDSYKKLRGECKDGSYTLDGCKDCVDNIFVVETDKAKGTH